jgi:Ca2+-binding RTX toxin-like protein
MVMSETHDGVGSIARRWWGRGTIAALVTSAAAWSCSAPGSSDAPAETVGSTKEAIHDPNQPLCDVAVDPGNGCCGYQLPNSLTGALDTYHNTNQKNFLVNLRAEMPLFQPTAFPFSDDQEVVITNGWAGHGAVDYVKSNIVNGDGSFPVRAVAAGQVVTVTYDNALGGSCCGTGNTVVIEHTAPSGEKYRSVYAHLRNGATNDCQQAKAFVAAGVGVNPAYKNFVDSQTCAPASLAFNTWGNETTTIAVTPGQIVQQGQIIAPAGNTGQGGIQKGLNADGSLGNSFANVHLHLFFTVFAPEAAPPAGLPGNEPWAQDAQWINVDPYGAYAQVTNDPGATPPKTNCYLMSANTEGHRLFAPFFPDFHAVQAVNLAHHFDYYPSMGFSMQTVSWYPINSQIFTAGSFQRGLSPVWAAEFGHSQSEFDAVFQEHLAEGLQLREISATPISGTPFFSGVWTQRTAAAGWAARINENDAEFATTQANTVAGGGRIADQFAYFLGSTRFHASVQVFDGVSPTNMVLGQNSATFNATNATNQANGLRPTSVSAEPPGGTTFGGVFVPAQGEWVVDAEITGGFQGYQDRYDQRIAEGRRLYRVQGYANGDKYAAIWAKNELHPSANFVATGGLTCTGPSGGTVTLNSTSTIFDPAFVIGWEWTGPFGTSNVQNPVVTLPPGTHTISLRVFDSRGFESKVTKTVTVQQDTTPPVLTPPPALTITTCTGVNLGTATAVDACGGAVTVTNNAPTKFPLGTTTVTWTARDQFGNTATATQLVTANLADDVSCCPNGTNIIQGNSNNNTLTGTSGSDCILGRGGQDTINGGGGNDFISGGDGDDTIHGDAGNDRIYGGSGQDHLFGDADTDFIQGGEGDDECRGGIGSDEVRGGPGNDRIFGEDGNDACFGEDGDDRLEGGAGNDALNGGGLHDTCVGGTGTNTFTLCQTVL